ncbi:MAG: DUF2628 domain-containing protein [Alphaproteobacteria bacterium]|nr:DUF2628 domain-containing protein [Alphaproteobacteria bacterium]
MSTITDLPAFVDHPDTIAFVGRSHLAYRESWLRAYKKKQSIKGVQRSISLNFPALLAFPFWCGYRKLYLPLAGFTLLIFPAILFEIFSGTLLPSWIYILFFLYAGTRANGLYLSRIIRFFEKNLNDKDEEDRARLIRRKGGTSVTSGALALLAFILSLVAEFQAGVLLAETLGFDVSHVYTS